MTHKKQGFKRNRKHKEYPESNKIKRSKNQNPDKSKCSKSPKLNDSGLETSKGWWAFVFFLSVWCLNKYSLSAPVKKKYLKWVSMGFFGKVDVVLMPAPPHWLDVCPERSTSQMKVVIRGFIEPTVAVGPPAVKIHMWFYNKSHLTA